MKTVLLLVGGAAVGAAAAVWGDWATRLDSAAAAYVGAPAADVGSDAARWREDTLTW